MKPSHARRNVTRSLIIVALLGGAGMLLYLAYLERSYREEPYSRIEDGLYLGGAVSEPPPGTRAVVNLCGRKDSYEVEAVFWEPILEDDEEPDIAWLERVVGFIEAQRRAGRPTFVHCLAGMNRSGMVMDDVCRRLTIINLSKILRPVRSTNDLRRVMSSFDLMARISSLA